MSPDTVPVDDFQALEQKIHRAVEIVRREREARLAAEAEVASLKEQLAGASGLHADAVTSLKTLEKERDDVRRRVEKMVAQMDELL